MLIITYENKIMNWKFLDTKLDFINIVFVPVVFFSIKKSCSLCYIKEAMLLRKGFSILVNNLNFYNLIMIIESNLISVNSSILI